MTDATISNSQAKGQIELSMIYSEWSIKVMTNFPSLIKQKADYCICCESRLSISVYGTQPRKQLYIWRMIEFVIFKQ